MIPPKTDPHWRQFVINVESFSPTLLPTRILCNRIKMLAATSSPTAIQEAIDAAHSFFEKNEKLAKNDIEAIFR